MGANMRAAWRSAGLRHETQDMNDFYARCSWAPVIVSAALLLGLGAHRNSHAETAGPTGAAPLPVSEFLSPEAQAALRERTELQRTLSAQTDLASLDRVTEEIAKSTLDRWLQIYPSDIEERTIEGVSVLIVTPKSGVARHNLRRVLLAAHQGGFIFGGRYSALAEAVPLAGRGRIKVIAVDYRKAPAFTFPAASEDMETVYRHVLRATRPANIGLYGCSAGGTLVAQAVARFQARALPRPGAISVMCSGILKSFWYGGDSQALSPAFTGRASPAAEPGAYFKGANMDDPLVTPGLHRGVLALFPPTLLVSGSRDIALSNAIMSHAALLEAGVDARLFVQEGLGHGHFYAFPGTRESDVAYNVIWNFFDAQLGK
jgi:epsilon-lactone hydrolase